MASISETPTMGGFAGFVIDLVKRRRPGRIQKQMKLVETLALGGKRQLMLVSCGEKKFLVGAGADGVQTIVAITADEVRL
jgi:flagellar biogenesis protein FliO